MSDIDVHISIVVVLGSSNIRLGSNLRNIFSGWPNTQSLSMEGGSGNYYNVWGTRWTKQRKKNNVPRVSRLFFLHKI